MSGYIVPMQMYISFICVLAAAAKMLMRFNALCRNNKTKLIYFKRKRSIIPKEKKIRFLYHWALIVVCSYGIKPC